MSSVKNHSQHRPYRGKKPSMYLCGSPFGENPQGAEKKRELDLPESAAVLVRRDARVVAECEDDPGGAGR